MFTDCITPPPGANVVSDSVSGSISCDICGKQYEDLIRLCCKYSGVFSFIVQVPAMEVAEQLEKFRIERPENIEFSHNHYITNENTEPGGRFYRVCPELCEYTSGSMAGILKILKILLSIGKTEAYFLLL